MESLKKLFISEWWARIWTKCKNKVSIKATVLLSVDYNYCYIKWINKNIIINLLINK